MIAVSTTAWWVIGWILGVVVVAIAAALLLAIVVLARRIGRQAREIERALEGAQENTSPLFDLASTNYLLERITREVAGLRAGESEREEPGLLERVRGRVRGSGA